MVVGGHARVNVAQKYDNVGRVNGDLCLITHLRQNNIVRFGLDTARIDQHQLTASPFGFTVNTVAGDAGGILDDGAALSDQTVEQRTFAHVRSADDGNEWFTHVYLPPLPYDVWHRRWVCLDWFRAARSKAHRHRLG